METLKQFDTIHEPDPRYRAFSVMDAKHPGFFRPLAIEDFYRGAESIRLHLGVPEAVRDHFETARNLLIYSWFYYPFNVTAQLSAFATVEYALRIKSGKPKARTGLGILLATAVKQKWISDNAFSAPKRRKDRVRDLNAALSSVCQFEEPYTLVTYCDILAKVLPKLRNTLAHGSSFLDNKGPERVRLCAELINQLFPAPHTQPVKGASS